MKNTFLDVRPEHSSSNESTLTAEAMTCLEFTRCSEALSSSSSSQDPEQGRPDSFFIFQGLGCLISSFKIKQGTLFHS